LGASENITIRNMTFGYSFGVSFGSHTSGGIKNVSVTYITMNGSRDGVHIKSQRERGGLSYKLAIKKFFEKKLIHKTRKLLIENKNTKISTI
jgi:polygalacturonase